MQIVDLVIKKIENTDKKKINYKMSSVEEKKLITKGTDFLDFAISNSTVKKGCDTLGQHCYVQCGFCRKSQIMHIHYAFNILLIKKPRI